MSVPVGSARRSARRRAALLYGGLLVGIAIAFVVTVAILNSTVYSASGFVRGYLHALDRGDTASALGLAGVTPSADDVLLTIPEDGRIDDISTTAKGDRVTASFLLDGTRHEAVYDVAPTGAFGGLFTAWGFRTTPTAFLDVTPEHDPRFTANGVDVKAEGSDIATRYTVLAPAVFDLTHDTTYLTADQTTVVAAAPGAVAKGTVDVEPRKSFTDGVRRDVTKYLRTTCVSQKVLFPAGCPFGKEVDDRVTSTPTWSMTAYPPVALKPTKTSGVWIVKRAAGRAHLEVEAQSLFDGQAYDIDEDVPFDVEYLVTIGADNNLTITPR